MMRKFVFPLINDKSPLFFILIDNLRYDQWKILEGFIQEYFQLESEKTYYSILPTTTAYARNSIFAGMMPSEIQKNFADKWVNDIGDSEDEEGFNQHEEFYLQEQVRRLKINAKPPIIKLFINIRENS